MLIEKCTIWVKGCYGWSGVRKMTGPSRWSYECPWRHEWAYTLDFCRLSKNCTNILKHQETHVTWVNSLHLLKLEGLRGYSQPRSTGLPIGGLERLLFPKLCKALIFMDLQMWGGYKQAQMFSDNEKAYLYTLHGMHEVLASHANTGKRVLLQPSLLFAACLQRIAGQCEPFNTCHTLLFCVIKPPGRQFWQTKNCLIRHFLSRFIRQTVSDQTRFKPLYQTKR